jgi:dsRNA-specific ribonuclease
VQLKWWTVDVAFQGRVMGSGGSFDKRDAGQAAARQALQRLGQLPGEA